MTATIIPFDRAKHPRSQADGQFVEAAHTDPGSNVLPMPPVAPVVTEDLGVDPLDWATWLNQDLPPFGHDRVDEAFPHGWLARNYNEQTGSYDYERRDPDGNLQPVLGYTNTEVEACLNRIADRVFDPGRVPAAGVYDAWTAGELADEIGCTVDDRNWDFTADVEALHAAELAGDRDGYLAALRHLYAHQTACDPIGRPAIDPGWAPPGVWTPVPAGWGRTYGPGHDTSLSANDITARVRADLKAAQKAGWLPAGANLSVRKNEYAGGWSVDVRVKGMSKEWFQQKDDQGDWQRNPDAKRLTGRIEQLVNAYNFDGSDYVGGRPATDYFDRRYSSNVAWDFTPHA